MKNINGSGTTKNIIQSNSIIDRDAMTKDITNRVRDFLSARGPINEGLLQEAEQMRAERVASKNARRNGKELLKRGSLVLPSFIKVAKGSPDYVEDVRPHKALRIICKRGYTHLLPAVFKRGAPNILGGYWSAIRGGHFDLADLFEKNAYLLSSPSSWTLNAAFESGKWSAVWRYTRRTEKVNWEDVLRSACLGGHLSLVKYVYDNAQSISSRSFDAALNGALRKDRTDVIEFLMSLPQFRLRSALVLACQNGKEEWASRFLMMGADNYDEAFSAAIVGRNLALIKRLQGLCNGRMRKVFHGACRACDFDLLFYSLSPRSDLDVSKGLQLSIVKGDPLFLALLLHFNATEVIDALTFACRKDREDLVRLILQSGIPSSVAAEVLSKKRFVTEIKSVRHLLKHASPDGLSCISDAVFCLTDGDTSGLPDELHAIKSITDPAEIQAACAKLIPKMKELKATEKKAMMDSDLTPTEKGYLSGKLTAWDLHADRVCRIERCGKVIKGLKLIVALIASLKKE